jgi:uncharacterized protein YndB with AHSA1/START domain
MLLSRLLLGLGTTVSALLTITNKEFNFKLGESLKITWKGAEGPVTIQAVYLNDDSPNSVVASEHFPTI